MPNNYKVGELIFIPPEVSHVWTGYYIIVGLDNTGVIVKHPQFDNGLFYFNEIRKLTKLEKLLYL